MNYAIDHDLHIHSNLSLCSHDPEQTPERILQYARENGLNTICLTNHFWDETVPGASNWYQKQDYAHISAALPLPQAEGIRFLFGCETDINQFLTLGISRQRMEDMDFIIIPTTHFHMKTALTEKDRATVQSRAAAWINRLDTVLTMDLPFHKVGLAHLTCHLIGPSRDICLAVLDAIPEQEFVRLFTKAAKLGVGIELNAEDMKYQPQEENTILRPYRVAKQCGCKFYLGSDAHEKPGLDMAWLRFQRAVEQLALTEEDKFFI